MFVQPDRHIHSRLVIDRRVAKRSIAAVLPAVTLTFFLVSPSPADGTITLSATAGTLSALSAGGTATGSGTVSATDTDSANWTLQAQDLGGGAGHMVASAAGCSGSTAQLTDALQVSVSTSLSGVTFAPAISLTASPQTVATGSNASMLAPTLFTTSFSQALPSTEVLRTNCAYTITITFTLQ